MSFGNRQPGCPQTFGSIVLLLGCLSVLSRARAEDEVYPVPFAFKGSADCLQCHVNPPPRLVGYSQDFVSLLESQAFFDEDSGKSEAGKEFFPRRDPHFGAYQALVDELGTRVTNRLGWTSARLDSEPDGKYDRQSAEHHQELKLNARLCMTCHVNWHPKAPEPPNAYQLHGVGCEACHGGSEKWRERHQEIGFRLMPPSEKRKRYGMVDVRNPIARARQCYSCHIGSVPDQKVVTHEMYAAGHPPLPAIEVEIYATTMPRHWRSLAEKGSFAHRQEFEQQNTSLKADELPRTKAMLVGGVVALMESIRLTADLTRGAPQGAREFAIYDCQECHHDLRTDSWRQRRYAKRPPGRIYPPQWPAALTLASTANGGLYPSSVDRFYRSFDQQLFGNAEQIADSSRVATVELEKLANTIASLAVTKETAEQIKRKLLAATASSSGASAPVLFDHQSASQLASGLFVVGVELQLAAGELAGGAGVEVDSRGYPKFSAVADSLADNPGARFDAGRQDFETFLHWKRDVLDPAERKVYEQLRADLTTLGLPVLGAPRSRGQLEAAASYDPRLFARQLQGN